MRDIILSPEEVLLQAEKFGFGEYAKTFRPGKDIQPIKMHKDIQTIAEVELLHFMKRKVK